MPLLRTASSTLIPRNKMKLSLLSNMISCTAYSYSAAFTASRTTAKTVTTRSFSKFGEAVVAPVFSLSTVATTSTSTNVRKSFTSLAYGEGMDQETMMESDFLIPVDKHDNPLTEESISKRKAHEFNSSQPRGIAHRAFSVFLFNKHNELLLTQRASTKITFPNVWTNTCCSHPLKDMIPNEVDTNDAYPNFPGIKHAAMRKLRHELGIMPKDVPFDDFRFLTRFHYWAADTVTYGNDTPWGEHEIDYILFIKCQEEPEIKADDEEVSDFEYVSLDRLKDCMYDDKKVLRGDDEMLFSPWFRGIMENGGFDWMEDLDGALDGEKYCNRDIYYFDPPTEHYAEYNLESHNRDTGVLEAKEIII